MTSVEASEKKNESTVYFNLYGDMEQLSSKPKVKFGNKVRINICDKEDELDELYDLAAMRHKRSLMNIYAKKSKEAMDNNIILADLLRAICTDIMNGNYKTYFNVTKCKISSIGEVKKE
ncbi:unnamed protein product, partial [Porites lobata]